MLKTLLKKQFTEIFRSFYVNRKTGEARVGKQSRALLVLYIFLFILIGGSFIAVFAGVGAQVLPAGYNSVYFAIAAFLSILVGAFGSVFNTYAGLYLPRDNELLLSLPIPQRTILLSRLAGVYLTSLMYSAMIWIPSVIVYHFFVPPTFTNIVFPVLLTLVIALLVSVLSCVLGWLVAMISSRMKGKSFFTVLFSLAFIAVYYVFYFRMNTILRGLAEHIDEVSQNIHKYLGFLEMLGRAADGEVLPMLAFCGIVFAAAAICFAAMTKTFLKVVLSDKKEKTKAIRQDDFRQTGVLPSLIKRELTHFTSVSSWMLNGGLGLILMPVMAVALIIEGNALNGILATLPAEVSILSDALPVLVTVLICIVIGMDGISVCSVSLEGKNLWIIQSLPVNAFDILRAKAIVPIALTVIPAEFLCITAGIVLKYTAVQMILSAVTVLAYILLTAYSGLFLNLKNVNLNWTNEITVVKQSMAVTVNLFGGWFFCGATAVAGIFLSGITGTEVFLSGLAVIYFAMFLALRHWVKTKGVATFEKL